MLKMKKKIILALTFFLLLLPLGNRLAFSAYRTDSAEVQTKVGNPQGPSPSTGSEVLNIANQMADLIRNSGACNGLVQGANPACLEEVKKFIPTSTKYPDRLYSEILSSVNNSYNYVLECAGFVQAVVLGVFGERLGGGGGYAGAWINNPPPGYQVINKGSIIIPGDIIVWSGNPGHIAFVNTVNERDFTVSEANYPCCGKVNNARSVMKDDPSYFIFLRKL